MFDVKIKESFEKILIDITTVNNAGTPTDPTDTTGALSIYLLDATTEALNEIAGSPFDLTKLDNKTGWFGYVLDTSNLNPGFYVVYVNFSLGNTSTHGSGRFIISSEENLINTINSTANNIETDTQDIQSTVNDNYNELTHATYGLQEIKNEINGLETDTTNIIEDVANVQTVVDRIETDTQAIEVDTQDIQNILNDSSTGLAEIKTEIQRIEVDTQDIQGTVNDIEVDVAAVKTVVDNNYNELTDNTSGLDALRTDISQLDSAIEGYVTNSLNSYDPPTKAEMDAAFSEIKGSGWDSTTDTLAEIKEEVQNIETDTQDIQNSIGTDSTKINDMHVLLTDADTGWSIIANRIIRMFKRVWNKTTLTKDSATQYTLKVYDDDENTVIQTQVITQSGNVETAGEST